MRRKRFQEHLVFICHSSLAVGVERSMAALVTAARGDGKAVTVVLPKPGPVLDLLRDIDGLTIVYSRAQWWMGTDHHRFRGWLKLVHAVSQVFRWAVLIGRLRPSVVLVMSTVIPAPMLSAWALRVPLVVFVSESIRTNPTLKSVVPKDCIIRLIRRWATVTVAVSRYAARQFGNTTLIEPPDIGDVDAESPLDHKSSGSMRKLVMLGTLSSEKGQFEAVTAVALAADEGRVLMLDLYGDADPPQLAALNRLIAEKRLGDRVRHRGPTISPLNALRAADLSLVCSHNEAYGRVTAESLAVGTPVLGYGTGGTEEILAEGGGMTVEPSADALAALLIRLASDEDAYVRLVLEARQRRKSRRGFGDSRHTLDNIQRVLSESSQSADG